MDLEEKEEFEKEKKKLAILYKEYLHTKNEFEGSKIKYYKALEDNIDENQLNELKKDCLKKEESSSIATRNYRSLKFRLMAIHAI